jgi:hydroxymethylbilane synthase
MRREAFDASQAWNLKANAVIGTSSARRKAQIIAQRPDLAIKELRGNVPTRIDKLRQGQYDAILLARAGVLRLELDLSDLETIVLDPTSFIPAPAQGVLGLQTRVDDVVTTEILQKLHHSDVATRIGLERSVLRQMDGGCQLPLGVYCVDDQVYVSFSPSSVVAAENKVYSYVAGQETALAQEIVQALKK